MIKKILIKFLEKKGYVSKWSLYNSKTKYDALYLLLFALKRRRYKIIQVGANDGVRNDPINRFIKDFSNSISYLGFEPQKIPFKDLKENYKSYSNFYFINQCIGEDNKTKFYFFNDNYKDLCKKKNWTFSNGTNSLMKENLYKRLKAANLNPDDYIDSFETSVLPLKRSIEINYPDILENFKNIDLLQVDAEGYDDEVIYNSSVDFFKPKYINFEHKNLTKVKYDKLKDFLMQNSYSCIEWKTSDCLAVLD